MSIGDWEGDLSHWPFVEQEVRGRSRDAGEPYVGVRFGHCNEWPDVLRQCLSLFDRPGQADLLCNRLLAPTKPIRVSLGHRCCYVFPRSLTHDKF